MRRQPEKLKSSRGLFATAKLLVYTLYPPPLAFDAPLLGSPSEHCHDVWYLYGTTRMVRLPDAPEVEDMFIKPPLATARAA